MAWLTHLPFLQDISLLLLRLGVGVMFALSGYFKLTKRQRGAQMRDTLKDVGLSGALARPLAGVELLAGMGLILGLLTVLSGLALLGISVVAFATTTWPSAKGRAIHKLENLLYAPEALLALALLVLIAFGAGGVSLDALLLG